MRRQTEKLLVNLFDLQVASLRRQIAHLTERLVTLEERVVLEGLNHPALPTSDDDPIDLDACEPGTLLRGRRGDWWFRGEKQWRIVSKDGVTTWWTHANPASAAEQDCCGPFEVVHRG